MAAAGLLYGGLSPIIALRSYRDRHYGIGFHSLAYPLQLALEPYVERIFGLDSYTSLLVAKQTVERAQS